jgi:hypothetical protein
MPDITTDADFALSVLGRLFKAEQEKAQYKNDVPGSISLTTNFMHGPQGIFGYPGAEQDVFSARVRPSGLLALLPASPSNTTNPLVYYLTGFTGDAGGSEITNVCDDPIESGDIKSCLQGALFGRISRSTKEIDLTRVGEVLNEGERMDLRLVNEPLVTDAALMLGGMFPTGVANALANEVVARWLTLGVAFERKLGPMVYTGTPANNTGGKGYEEFHGLETLVGTGKIDVIDGTTCPALDSFMRNFGNVRIDTAASSLFSHLVVMWREVNDRASRMGLAPATFAFVMRRDLFSELADLWPCIYATYRCGVQNVQDSTLDRIVVDGMAQRTMSDNIRTGKYLPIDGVNVPVIIDDFIPEDSQTNNSALRSGCFSSDIYLLPLTVMGGRVVLYLEYFNFSGPGAAISQVQLGNVSSMYWTDAGRFLWWFYNTSTCIKWAALVRPRLRLMTPQLAARIQNVAYCPSQHFREDNPSSSYFAAGGDVAARSTAALYDSGDFPSAIS